MAEYVLDQVASEVQLAINKALSSVQSVNGVLPDVDGNVEVVLPDLVCKVHIPLFTLVDTVMTRPLDDLNRTPKVGEIFTAMCAKRHTILQVVAVNQTQYAAKVLAILDLGVQTVNGIAPDLNGNVNVESGTVSTEQIAQAVADYMAKNPVTSGSVVRTDEVALPAANWTGEGNRYSQVVQIDGVTANSQVDLTPSVDQLVIFYEKSLALVAENTAGVVTVYAIGQKPENDYTIQVTLTEVNV